MDELLSKMVIYQNARKLSGRVWGIYKKLPHELKYSLGNQLITSTDSVGANFCEGYGRFHVKEKIQFLHISRGSLYEMEYWLQLCLDREIITHKEYTEIGLIVKKIGVKLANYLSHLKNKP